jgi:hypothetical protein
MNKTTRLIGTGFIGVVCFIYVTFSIIHMAKINEKVEEWEESYRAIEEDVAAFVEVSDPKSIRLYTTELRKILDEIHFLGRIVESGQLADETLMNILDEQEHLKVQLEVLTDTLYNHTEHASHQFRGLWSNIESQQWELGEIPYIVKDVKKSREEMNENLIKELMVIHTDLDSIRTTINDLKDSKINKFW